MDAKYDEAPGWPTSSDSHRRRRGRHCQLLGGRAPMARPGSPRTGATARAEVHEPGWTKHARRTRWRRSNIERPPRRRKRRACSRSARQGHRHCPPISRRRGRRRPARECQRQSKRKAVLCQRFTVSGSIRCTRSSQLPSTLESATQSRRKAGVNWRRRHRFSSTASWLSAASTRPASRAFGSSSAQRKQRA